MTAKRFASKSEIKDVECPRERQKIIDRHVEKYLANGGKVTKYDTRVWQQHERDKWEYGKIKS
jgi:hypothetical protein